MNHTAFAAIAALSVLSLNAATWQGFTDSGHYSGPKITEADLAGKVATAMSNAAARGENARIAANNVLKDYDP